MMFKVLTCALVLFMCYVGVKAESLCDAYVSEVEGSYWDEVGKCPQCTATPGCGYCLSTLRCMDGDADGPTEGHCPDWIFGRHIGSCPGKF